MTTTAINTSRERWAYAIVSNGRLRLEIHYDGPRPAEQLQSLGDIVRVWKLNTSGRFAKMSYMELWNELQQIWNTGGLEGLPPSKQT